MVRFGLRRGGWVKHMETAGYIIIGAIAERISFSAFIAAELAMGESLWVGLLVADRGGCDGFIDEVGDSESCHDLRDVGEHDLKGVPGPWRLFSVQP